jgi:hypothetical protein
MAFCDSCRGPSTVGPCPAKCPSGESKETLAMMHVHHHSTGVCETIMEHMLVGYSPRNVNLHAHTGIAQWFSLGGTKLMCTADVQRKVLNCISHAEVQRKEALSPDTIPDNHCMHSTKPCRCRNYRRRREHELPEDCQWHWPISWTSLWDSDELSDQRAPYVCLSRLQPSKWRCAREHSAERALNACST